MAVDQTFFLFNDRYVGHVKVKAILSQIKTDVELATVRRQLARKKPSRSQFRRAKRQYNFLKKSTFIRPKHFKSDDNVF